MKKIVLLACALVLLPSAWAQNKVNQQSVIDGSVSNTATAGGVSVQTIADQNIHENTAIRTVNGKTTISKTIVSQDADRQTGSTATKNYTNAELNGQNFSNRDLSGFSFVNASLKNANFSGSNLSNAVLNNADLTGANLSGANLSNAVLTNVDFSHANMTKVNLQGAKIINTEFSGARLTGAKWVNGTICSDKTASQCR